MTGTVTMVSSRVHPVAVRGLAWRIGWCVGLGPALAACPMPTDRQGQADVALQLHGFWLPPGEWLCADADGMVVLPTTP